MDQVALRLSGAPTWTGIGGAAEAAKPFDLVLRSFDRDVELATGEDRSAPNSSPVRVPAGEGRRLTGRWFFVRPTLDGPPCRVTFRGVDA